MWTESKEQRQARYRRAKAALAAAGLTTRGRPRQTHVPFTSETERRQWQRQYAKEYMERRAAGFYANGLTSRGRPRRRPAFLMTTAERLALVVNIDEFATNLGVIHELLPTTVRAQALAVAHQLGEIRKRIKLEGKS